MEWITKIVNIIKIPLKVLLPAVWIFSAFLVFSNEKLLNDLNLLTWKKENGFTLGLLFLISTSLIIVYAIYYLKSKLNDILFKLTINRKTMRTISKFSEKEMDIIMQMYCSDGYTMNINYADPVVKGLIARNYIYVGNNAPVIPDWNNRLWVNGALQPFVWQAVQWFYQKNEKRIHKLEKIVEKENDKDKLISIKQKLNDCYQIRDNLRRN